MQPFNLRGDSGFLGLETSSRMRIPALCRAARLRLGSNTRRPGLSAKYQRGLRRRRRSGAHWPPARPSRPPPASRPFSATPPPGARSRSPERGGGGRESRARGSGGVRRPLLGAPAHRHGTRAQGPCRDALGAHPHVLTFPGSQTPSQELPVPVAAARRESFLFATRPV